MPVFIDVSENHKALVTELLERAHQFLKLKDCNSVRLLLTCSLDPTFGQREHAHPSPILVRVRISNVQSGDDINNLSCEFRIASAEAFETAARVTFEYVRKSVLKFFDTQFNANHWYHITTINARMIMREPLGTLAAMEGYSNLFVSNSNGLNRETHILKFVTDEKSLAEF